MLCRHPGGNSPDGAGLGLGLAIVSELSAAMGGNAGVEDRPNGGAQFTVTLPPRAAA